MIVEIVGSVELYKKIVST